LRVALHPCFVLHQRPYRETSLILEILSREHGRLALVARGVKRGNYSRRSLMQPNRRLLLAWHQRGDMGTLTDIEADGLPFDLHGKKLLSAFYLNELLMRLLHRHEAHPELYDDFGLTLQQLQTVEDDQRTLRLFEKRLLDTLGYGLILDHEVRSGGRIEADRVYYYQVESGPVSQMPDTPDYLEIGGSTLLALAAEALERETELQQAKRLMRFVLDRYLGGRALASRELYQAYLQGTPGTNTGTP